MTPAQHERVVEVFGAAVDVPHERRPAFVRERCGDDPAVEARVLAMLRRDGAASGPFGTALDGIGARLVRGAFPPSPDGAAVTADAREPVPDPAPERIGPYRIVRTIAEGGMGSVYEAEQEHPHRVVALKTVRDGLRSRAVMRRFEREIRLLGRLQHPGIAQIYDAGMAETERGAIPYFTMELIRGLPIDEFARHVGLSTRGRLMLIAQACDAIEHAHRRGIIHRDLKPANVVVECEVDGTPRVKVLDFGIARALESHDDCTTVHTDARQLVGTLAYMSPEQVSGRPEELDGRTDVYSMGVLTYELLAGDVPLDVRHRSVPEIVQAIREQDPRRLSSVDVAFRGEIETIVARAMEKDRERRYATAADLAEDIRRHLADQPIVARPATVLYQLRKFVKRNRALVAGVIVALLAVLSGTALSTWWAIDASAAREAESAAADTARRREAEMRWLAYRSSISAAQALLDRNPQEARRQLDAAPAEHRNWEWRYYSHLVGTPIRDFGISGHHTFDVLGTPVVARAEGSRARVINAQTGEDRLSLECPWEVTSVHLADHASVLCAHSMEARAALVQDVGGRLRSCTIELSDSVDGAPVLSPDGSGLMVFGPEEAAFTYFDTTTGGERWRCPAPAAGRWVVFAGPGSETLTIGTRFHRAVVDATTGRFLEEWQARPEGRGESLSPDARLRATWSAVLPELHVTDARTGAALHTLKGHLGGTLSGHFSPTGRFLATQGFDSVTRVWDVASGSELASVVVPRWGRNEFSPDERLLWCSGDPALLWRWQANEPAKVLRGHTSYVYLLALSPGGAMLASAGWDSTIRVWDPVNGDELAVLAFPSNYVRALGFSADGAHLRALGWEFPPHEWNETTWDVGTWQVVASSGATEPAAEPSQEEVMPDRPFWTAVAGDSRGARRSGGENAVLSHDRSLLARSEQGAIEVVDVRTQDVVHHFDVDGYAARALAFSVDDRLLASSGWEGALHIWDLANGGCRTKETTSPPKVYTLVFSPDGTRLASGGNDARICLWDTASLDLVGVLLGHDEYVHSLRFSEDGARLYSASGDGTVRIWSAAGRSAAE